MPPFLLGESYGDARMGIPRLLGVCSALLFASSVSAANIINLGPSDYKNYGPNASHTSGGVRSSFGQTVRMPPMNTNLTVSRNAVIPYGSIANGARNFLRINPASAAASAAITALALGLDWAFDSETDSWMKEGIETDPELGDFYWYARYDDSITSENPASLCASITPEPFREQYALRTYEYSGTEFTSATEGRCNYDVTVTYDSGSVSHRTHYITIRRGGSQCQAPAVYYPSLGMCGISGFVPLESSDWADFEDALRSNPPGLASGAASDIMRRQGAPLPGFQDQTITGPSSVTGPQTTSTSTDPATGDTIVTNTSTQTNISYGDTTITTTNTTTSTTYQNGQETGTTVTTETPGELPVTDSGGVPPAGEWPGFCDWASVVCDWLNWTQEDPPPEEDLPAVIDDDFFEEKNISFGAKSCPPDYELNLAPFLPQAVAVSFQPICDFAALIYYMVMAASYIIAAYISIGVARNA